MLIEQITENRQIEEGVDDPHIFKAIFMAGGPGSGKSYTAKKLFKGTGLKTVNSDDIYEYLMTNKHGLDLSPETIFSPQGQEIRGDAKRITSNKQNLFIDGRLGMVIDGTGKDVDKINKAKAELEAIGYETMMVFVNTNIETAQARNKKRERTLEPSVVEKMWKRVQDNIQAFQRSFGQRNFVVVDSSEGADYDANIAYADKPIRSFLSSSPRSRAAREWIKQARTSKSQR